MPVNFNDPIVQCSFSVTSWKRYQRVCKEIHINAAPYFCDFLSRELVTIEEQVEVNKSRDKKKGNIEYFEYKLNTAEKNVAKIPMKKSLVDNLNRISDHLDISRDVIIEEVLSLILDYDSAGFESDTQLDISSNNVDEWGWFESKAEFSLNNSCLFSPLRLAYVGFKNPHLYSSLLAIKGENITGASPQEVSKWYEEMGQNGINYDESKSFISLFAEKHNLSMDSDIIKDLMSSNIKSSSSIMNVYRVTFPDGTVYIAAKKAKPESAEKSLRWAKKAANSRRPLVAAYLKSDGESHIETLHTGLEKEEALRLKANYVEEAKANKLNVIY
ncbi:hypothetical protein [Moritella sp. F3]|uniref:hypothetical protein n=1 Tax=Moritella sp. F3 TaxID=2718882 RepID=UPI001A1A8CA4|nr:hypothetical protein [Moritella sp. F3]GIC75607.1 hypothetical protein FMO001_03340 [Moritella sp. F1]GIC80752.1 hypothetical protein FMO003_10330 [Moritella sp. F3]